jgi:uncharacterized repeat protein (TIGR01451 family)
MSKLANPLLADAGDLVTFIVLVTNSNAANVTTAYISSSPMSWTAISA